MFIICYVIYVILCVHSSFAIILKRKKKMVYLVLHVLSYGCIVTSVLWLFLMVPWVGL